jgi:hypothetical protein
VLKLWLESPALDREDSVSIPSLHLSRDPLMAATSTHPTFVPIRLSTRKSLRLLLGSDPTYQEKEPDDADDRREPLSALDLSENERRKHYAANSQEDAHISAVVGRTRRKARHEVRLVRARRSPDRTSRNTHSTPATSPGGRGDGQRPRPSRSALWTPKLINHLSPTVYLGFHPEQINGETGTRKPGTGGMLPLFSFGMGNTHLFPSYYGNEK